MGFWPVVNHVILDSDIVVVVADARLPEMSINRELLDKITYKKRPYVIAFTKKDLVDVQHQKMIRKAYPQAYLVSGTKNEGVSALRRGLQILSKQMKLSEPKIGIVGYPNLGKSALINALARGRRAEVANMPGTTKGSQWVKTNGLCLLDTPGVIPFEDKHVKLGLLGSKSPDKMRDPEKVAYELIEMFLIKNANALRDFYGLEKLGEDAYEIFEQIGKKRGYLLKGGRLDERRTATSIVRDWHSGKLKY